MSLGRIVSRRNVTTDQRRGGNDDEYVSQGAGGEIWTEIQRRILDEGRCMIMIKRTQLRRRKIKDPGVKSCYVSVG
jgi:hypothetical protein